MHIPLNAQTDSLMKGAEVVITYLRSKQHLAAPYVLLAKTKTKKTHQPMGYSQITL